MTNCLIIGSGGREHALAWKLSRSREAGKIYIAPGNAGSATVGTNLPVREDDHEGILALARENKVGLTVIGPEAPLAAGLADFLGEKGQLVFGPGKKAARLETSKVFAKDFMIRHEIPTAENQAAVSRNEASEVLRKWGKRPAVIKVDGLAAGKGVFICENEEEKQAALGRIYDRGEFGIAGQKVIFEEKLEGRELSVMVISDGNQRFLLPPARDHKKAGENDTGPNTGGMGAFAPVPSPGKDPAEEIKEKIINPVFDALAEEGIIYRGILYFGLMLTSRGPMVLEFNARFGDPETQAVLPLVENDFLELLTAAAAGQMNGLKPLFRPGFAGCVIMASGGYPGEYRKGVPIHGLDGLKESDNLVIFHSGTARRDGEIVTSGGRVLGITGVDESLSGAMQHAYRAIKEISFENAFYRRDIAGEETRKSEPSG